MLDSYLTTCDIRLLINNERWHLFASEKSVKAKIRNRLNIYKESLQPSTALRRVGCFWVAPHCEEGMLGRDHCNSQPRILDRHKTVANISR